MFLLCVLSITVEHCMLLCVLCLWAVATTSVVVCGRVDLPVGMGITAASNNHGLCMAATRSTYPCRTWF